MTHFFKNRHKNNRAFTLIELLVVVAIISLMSSVVISSLNSARARARDAKRMSDVRQIHLALQIYYDLNGQYPACQTHFIANGTTECLSQALIASGSMSRLPTDPLSSGAGTWGVDYQYQSPAGSDYFIRAVLEGKPVNQTHRYPDSITCQSPSSLPICPWRGTSCTYLTGGSCNTLWYHMGG